MLYLILFQNGNHTEGTVLKYFLLLIPRLYRATSLSTISKNMGILYAIQYCI
jgi:hypothetical protein